MQLFVIRTRSTYAVADINEQVVLSGFWSREEAAAAAVRFAQEWGAAGYVIYH